MGSLHPFLCTILLKPLLILMPISQRDMENYRCRATESQASDLGLSDRRAPVFAKSGASGLLPPTLSPGQDAPWPHGSV